MKDIFKGILIAVIAGVIVWLITESCDSSITGTTSPLSLESSILENTETPTEKPSEKPVYLSELDPYATETKSDVYVFLGYSIENWEATEKDNLGNLYSNGYKFQVFDINDGEEYEIDLTFDLKGKYNEINGSFVVLEESKNLTRDIYYAVLYIYADDVEVYKSDILRGGVRPIEFSANLNNAKDLKVKFKCSKDLGFGIVDTILYP